MSEDREYMKEYMRRYREKQAAAEGRVLRKYAGRRREKPQRVIPTLAAPGWPTLSQMMAGR